MPHNGRHDPDEPPHQATKEEFEEQLAATLQVDAADPTSTGSPTPNETALGAAPDPELTDLRIESVAIGLPDDEDSWHKRILLTYEDGATESLQGTLFEASELAFSHGLTLAPSPAGSFRWVRVPDTWSQA